METKTGTSSESARFGRYEIISKLATGGMGEVYLARSIGAAGFQKHVVIKKILPHLVEQPSIVEALVHEAKLLVRMDHPNIVQVLDLGMEGSNYFMAMEFVHGYNLSSIIGYCAKYKELIPAPVCAHLAAEMLSGLQYIHELTDLDGKPMNIVHRDISPQNVLVSREGRVKLADFGIAKVLHEAEGALTQSLKGKLKYMAPEALEEGRIDQRYDLFAAGIVLFEALARAHLYRGKNDAELMKMVREARVPPVSRYHENLPRALEVVTLKALSKDPEHRFQSAKEFARALREAVQPATQQECEEHLQRLLADLYNRPDFPASKSKLPDLTATRSGEVQPLLIQSRLESPRVPLETLPRPAVAGRHVTPIITLLTVGFVGISVVVGYILYTLQDRTRTGPTEKGQVIIVEQHDRRPPLRAPDAGRVVAAAARPDATGAAVHGEPSDDTTPAAKRRPPRPAPRPAAFDPAVGARTFRRHGRALTDCFNKHTKPTDPEIRLKVISTIRDNGSVSEVHLEPPDQNATPLGRCVVQVASKIRYARHDKPAVTFHQPLRVTRNP